MNPQTSSVARKSWTRPRLALRARRLVRAMLGLWLVAGLSAADGDVSAYVDAGGDLWLIADELDNGVRVSAGGDDTDTFRIAGLDATTTINGQPAVTLVAPGTRMVLLLGAGHNRAVLGTDYGSSPSCCYRQLVVIGGAGRDELEMVGRFLWLTADLGPGDDSIASGEGAVGLGGTLLFGDGDDALSVSEFTGLSGYVDMGPGNDLVFVGRESGVGGTLELGSGDDRVELQGVAGGDLELNAGDGDDVLALDKVRRGSLALDAGGGSDRVHLTGDRGARSAAAVEPVSIRLGAGDDHLEVGGAELGVALFDGGVGLDGYLDLGGNDFAAGPPELRAFELPKGARGLALDVPTAIAGRVVAEGVAVPGASVLVPELGLRTATDEDGAFRFDSLVDERQALELVVGATVRGRARSGAARVELLPFGTSAAGDVVLAPALRNVLVHGAGGAVLEGNLVALGLRPEEVTRLAELPEDLSPYGVIWHLGDVLSALERQRLVGFVRAGRGLHLQRASAQDDASLEALVNQLVRGGGIAVGVRGTASSGLYSFNPDAAGGVTTHPNVLTTLQRSAFSRYVTGLAPRNALLTMTTSGDVPGAVWDSADLLGGRGHLTLLTDGSWIAAGESLDVLENLQAFLRRAPEGEPAR